MLLRARAPSLLALLALVPVLALGCAAAEVDDASGRCANGGCVDAGGDDASDRDTEGTGDTKGGGDSGSTVDTAGSDGIATDGAKIDTGSGDGAPIDSGKIDSGAIDSAPVDTGKSDTGFDAGPTGPITGGPCSSGAAGATAFRIKWINGGGKATVSYEVDGLPDKSRWKAGAYGYSIGFSPSFVDPFLGEGGLQLDSSDFVDVELSTVGLSSIRSATLAIYGRSYNTTTSGSFNWMTFTDSGSTPTDFVSNVAPYRWYAYDATSAFRTGDGGTLLRIKAGPSSGALVVNRIELCMDAS
jgi:hypothetical protein